MKSTRCREPDQSLAFFPHPVPRQRLLPKREWDRGESEQLLSFKIKRIYQALDASMCINKNVEKQLQAFAIRKPSISCWPAEFLVGVEHHPAPRAGVPPSSPSLSGHRRLRSQPGPCGMISWTWMGCLLQIKILWLLNDYCISLVTIIIIIISLLYNVTI